MMAEETEKEIIARYHETLAAEVERWSLEGPNGKLAAYERALEDCKPEDVVGAVWADADDLISRAMAALRASVAREKALREALAELEHAADLVLHGLEERIDAADPSAVPVFDGIVELHDAIPRARAALEGAPHE